MIKFTNRRPLLLLAGATLVVITAAAVTLSKPADKVQAAKPPPLVSISQAVAKDLPIKLDTQGHVVALTQVDVRPQATGTIRQVHFKEGDEVRSGQLMFTIDASDVAAQLAKSRAAAAQVKAQLEEAQRDLQRTRQLAQAQFYSPSSVDAAEGKVASLRAQHEAMLADIDNSRVLVDRTRVVAPMAGLTGVLAVHAGSLAQQSATTPLVNIVQMDPVGVEFTLPEANLATLLAARDAGTVQISVIAADGSTVDGKLVFVNNTVNADTGTISLKASFPNAHKKLWPGAYAKVRVTAGVDRGAVTLAPQSVLDGPNGRFVFVLDGGAGKVSVRPVTLLRIQDQLAIVKGLVNGEQVVTEGQLNLKDGMAVRMAVASAASEPRSGL